MNFLAAGAQDPKARSPSVRRAWIEIRVAGGTGAEAAVALREEGVD